jgi:hypothetical protein
MSLSVALLHGQNCKRHQQPRDKDMVKKQLGSLVKSSDLSNLLKEDALLLLESSLRLQGMAENVRLLLSYLFIQKTHRLTPEDQIRCRNLHKTMQLPLDWFQF